jgi:hypothetical protein
MIRAFWFSEEEEWGLYLDFHHNDEAAVII